MLMMKIHVLVWRSNKVLQYDYINIIEYFKMSSRKDKIMKECFILNNHQYSEFLQSVIKTYSMLICFTEFVICYLNIFLKYIWFNFFINQGSQS